ncbi:probable ATP-dependent RNA helicase ddx17 [Palaemon carinicauda]|uniref:probable ATP-dependent RNA helicase ddx17 n=1 Tax=Palaemon carinicauda TaxID=392227 RepID=UPI0035B5ABA0
MSAAHIQFLEEEDWDMEIEQDEMEKRRLDTQGHDLASHGENKYPRTESNNSYGYDKGSNSYSRNESYNTYPPRDSNYSSSRNSGSSNSYSSRDNYSSRDSSSNYSRDNYSRDTPSYQSRDSGGYSRNDYSSSRDNYSRDGGYRSDSYNSSGSRGQRGGYNGRGRGGRGGYGGQSGDSWSCSSCKFSNYASRTSCYKCRTPKDGSGGGRRWDSNDSGWKKPSWGDGRNRRDDDGKKSSWGKSEKADCIGDSLINWDEAIKKADEMDAEKWAAMPKIVKDLYIEDPAIASMTDEEVKDFRKSNFDMEVKCINKEFQIPNPVKLFEQAFSSYPLILKEISKQGFENPSAIQCQSWPILMKGYDMIGTSHTGSGKTLAFLLPALLHICAQPTPRWERPGPTCLVLAPTRELAQQIEREVIKFQYENIRVVCCYGQGDKRHQIQKLNAMSEIVIATPGRLNDFVSQGVSKVEGNYKHYRQESTTH